MPEYLAPGVFVEETSFRQKSIEGVGTSTAAFVGATRFGPVDGLPELLASFGDFERVYGGIDPLSIDGDDVPNLLAAGVRAFFTNGGRRCYVARATHTSTPPATAVGQIPTTGDHLVLRARHPGRAGNFQVSLTLRMGPNVLEVPPRSQFPRLRGADEYQVVWIDEHDGQPSQLAYLHDEFDEVNNTWTYRLMRDGADPVVGLGLVTELDPAVTSDVRVLTVDLDVGPLGRFLDGQSWPGLSLHPEHRNSMHRVFATDGDRQTELFVPLVVESSPGLADGPAIAAVLLAASGGAAGLSGTGINLSLGGAIDGTVELTFDDGGTSRAVDITVGDTAAAVTAALTGAGLTSPVVSRPQPGAYVIAVDGTHSVAPTSNTLQLPGSVSLRRGTRFVIDTSPAGRFALLVDGATTASFNSNVSPNTIDDALDAIVGVDNASAFRDSTDRLVVTLWGSHERNLTIVDNATLVGGPIPIVAIELLAAGGTFEIGLPGSIESVPAPASSADADMAPTATAMGTAFENALGGAGPEVPTVDVEDGVFIVAMTPTTVAGGIVIGDTSALTAADGTATPTVTPVLDSLLTPGHTESLAARLAGGTDGDFPDPDGFAGDADGVRKSGLGAFTDLPDVSIVAAPGSTWDFAGRPDEARQTISSLITHCERMRYRIAIVDPGAGQLPSEVAALRGEFDSSHAAMYYPWVTTYDQVTLRPQDFPPSGYVAGVYARNDVERGVHKAPANETIALAIGFEASVNTAQQELLNPLGVNCLRKLDQRGRRIWGARTMSSDPEWKYVNLRRYFAYLEASIDRGTQWAVFEPNGPMLWQNVRRTVEDFLINEFANGRLLGEDPKEAFFVRCDRSTMTQNDLDNGRLVCLIAVAPLRPAEFVIFRIGQKTLDAGI